MTYEKRAGYRYESNQCSVCGTVAIDTGERYECPNCGLASPKSSDVVDRFQKWCFINAALRGDQRGWFALMENIPYKG